MFINIKNISFIEKLILSRMNKHQANISPDEIRKYYDTLQSTDKHAEGPTLKYHLGEMINVYQQLQNDEIAGTAEIMTILKSIPEEDVYDFIIFHDIGKEDTKSEKEGSISNIGHEKKSAEIIITLNINTAVQLK